MSARPRRRAPVVRSFAPLVDDNSRVLILGSMPGAASLAARQYYAHPQNTFWRILADVIELDAAAPYPERVARLLRAKLALWDVLASCARSSSADADIDDASARANDVAGLVRAHPRLHTVVLNGKKAAQVFARRIEPSLPRALDVVTAPSTSPAYASMRYADKLAAWRRALV